MLSRRKLRVRHTPRTARRVLIFAVFSIEFGPGVRHWNRTGVQSGPDSNKKLNGPSRVVGRQEETKLGPRPKSKTHATRRSFSHFRTPSPHIRRSDSNIPANRLSIFKSLVRSHLVAYGVLPFGATPRNPQTSAYSNVRGFRSSRSPTTNLLHENLNEKHRHLISIPYSATQSRLDCRRNPFTSSIVSNLDPSRRPKVDQSKVYHSALECKHYRISRT